MNDLHADDSSRLVSTHRVVFSLFTC